MKFAAVISDLDGIIVNSETEHFLSFQKMLRKEYNIDYTHEDDKEFLGTTDQHVFGMLKKRYPQIKDPMRDLIRHRTQYFIEIFKERAKALPCVKSLYKSFIDQGIPMALGTSASRGIAKFILETLELKSFFKHIVTADDVFHGKPEPDIYLKAAKDLGIDPKHCLVFEDSNYGVQAAKTAGMKCIAVPCGPTLKQDLSRADHILKSMCDVTPELLDALHEQELT